MFGSIEETRVTFVEKGATQERSAFLKKLLEHNGFVVLIGEDKKKTDHSFISAMCTFTCISFHLNTILDHHQPAYAQYFSVPHSLPTCKRKGESITKYFEVVFYFEEKKQ